MYQLIFYHILHKRASAQLKLPHNYGHGQKDLFEHDNLAYSEYSYLKKCCMKSTRGRDTPFHKIRGTVSPFNLRIGQSSLQIVRKVGLPFHITHNKNLMKGYFTWFYKIWIGDLKCTFQLHFHKNKLFLCKVNISEKSMHGVDIVELLLGRDSTQGSYFGREGFRYFEDSIGQVICAHTDLFSTQLTISCPGCESLQHFMNMKYSSTRSRTGPKSETYSQAFVKAI